MIRELARVGAVALPIALAVSNLVVLAVLFAQRAGYPFDLEWMEGGMLAHAWRLREGLPLYVRPNPDFVPYVYPPGYAALVAALSVPFGLSLPLGRAVSIAAVCVAALAVGRGVRAAGGATWLAFATAAVFLSTWPQAGAFYDLVRPDSLLVALLGWSFVLGQDERKGAPVAAGLLLAAAFLVKHNAAIFGVPMLLGLALRGPRPAVSFLLASALPAAGMTALLQWRSGGLFLVWLLQVPASHPLLTNRALFDAPREWGNALPVALGLGTLLVLWRAMSAQRTLPPWAVAAPSVFSGVLLGWWATYAPPPTELDTATVPASLAYFALGALPVALASWALGAGVERWRDGVGNRPPWRIVYAGGILATALLATTLMRMHGGGFVNVHAPLLWCGALAFGVTVIHVPAPWARAAVSAQLLWSLAQIDADRLLPTRRDLEVGWHFVRRAEAVDGPVLSPFSAWIPVYAGKPPSLHAMGIWDCNMEGGPFRDDLAQVKRAIREHHWALVIGGNDRLIGDLTQHYEPGEELVRPDDDALMPKTGYRARPWRLMTPREAGW